MKPTIAISAGDPAGIGPEVVLKALADPEVERLARWIVVCDRPVLTTAESVTGISSVTLAEVEFRPTGAIVSPDQFTPGVLSAEAGRAALSYVRAAAELCLDGRAQAMVTAPLNKEAVTLSGQEFTGHTEYIAELCGARESRMLLVGPRLRVVHVTTHRALRDACNLEQDRIEKTIELGHAAMRLLGFDSPRIAVCGLNPHAGENRLFGNEDLDIILPAIEACRSRGVPCQGPFAADTIFLQAVRGAYDLVVAMYHDQGHIPMKLLDFEQTVNVSLGLPIIRTSVDHGTAFDIAGRNVADASSMKAAMRLAAVMASRSARGTGGSA